MTQIKISGLTDPRDAELVGSAGIDLATCVFHARSPRYVTLSQVWEIRRALPPQVALVGVFVDTPTPLVVQIAQGCGLDFVQLFGRETRADVQAVGPHAFKAVTIESPGEVDDAARTFLGRRGREGPAPALLVHLTGALAMAWHLVAEVSARAPIVLAAGGLEAASVRSAIAAARPWAVDVWDAVEREPGRIDRARLGAFVSAARAADDELAANPSQEDSP